MQTGNWYDHPQYFDMVFRDETPFEVRFFEQAFEQYAQGPVRRLYEPGCGSGRLVTAMAARGYCVTGLDLSDPSLKYLRRKLNRRGLGAELLRGDMTTHVVQPQCDAAFCTFNTFRHLMDQESVDRHFASIAASLRPGGIYILGFHIIPLDAEEKCIERWRARHGGTSVTTTLRVTEFDRRRRVENLRITLTAQRNSGTFRCRTEFPLRLYTHHQVRKLLNRLTDFETVGIHDFDYDIDGGRQLDNDLTDAVFVLRRR